jgi:putative ABC transport system ATP-binding protein
MTQLTAAPLTATAPVRTVAEARSVTKIYGRGEGAVRALDAVDVSIEAGVLTAVMGPSGSGKSTLMHVLAGLDEFDSGEVVLAGVELSGLSERRRTLLRRDRVGFVFQGFNLVPALTAEENILLPLLLAGRRPDAAWLAHLVEVLGLQERLRHRPSQLSGGQQQRVAAARALVTRPEIVFADEPTGNLDSRHGQALLAFLRGAVEELGQSVVMVTHDPTAASYAHRVLHLVDGRVADDRRGE